MTGEFTLSVSAQVLNYDNEETADDAKIGIWVDGALIGGQFFVLLDGFDGSHIQSQLYFVANSSVNIKVASTDNKLRKLTLNDFGFASGTYEATSLTEFAGTKRPDTLLNTTMTMDVNMTGGGNTWIQYATSTRSTWYGISIQIDSTAVTVQCKDVNGTSIHSDMWKEGSAFGMTSFMDTPYKLTLSLEQIDMHGDGANDDVRLGVRFNGRLYCDQFIYLENSSGVVGNGIALFQNRYGDGSTKTTTTLSNPAQSYDTMEALTLEDFGVTAQEYTSANHGLLTGSADGYRGSMDGKIFSTDVRFNSYDSELFYGCRVGAKQNYWYTFKIGAATAVDEDKNTGSRVFRVTDSTGKFGDAVLDAGIAGVMLMNDTYNLKISTRNVDCDGDDLFDDLELGIWFNGVLYNNSFWYAEDAADWFEPHLAVYCASERGSVSLGTFEQTEATEVTYCMDDADYFVDGNEVTVDGKSYGTSTNLSKPGVYDVTYTDEGTSGSSKYMKNVTVYKTHDATANGDVDVRDLVALKMYIDNKRDLDKSGEKAIGAGDSFVGETAYDSMVECLLSFDKEIEAKELSENIIGATGSGTYVADVDRTEEGTSVMSITDENKRATLTLKEAEETGDNILTFTDFNLDGMTKVLAGEKYTYVGADGADKLHGKTLEGIFNFNAGGNYVYLGGNWKGLRLTPDSASNSILVQYVSGSATSIGSITPEEVEASTLFGVDLDMKISFEFADPTATTTNVTATIAIGDTYTEDFVMESVATDSLRQRMLLYSQSSGCPLVLKTKNLTFADFGMDTATTLDGEELKVTAGDGGLNLTSIEGYYNFSNGGNYVYYGGSWTGIRLAPNTSGNLDVIYVDANYNSTELGSILASDVNKSLTENDIKIKADFEITTVDANTVDAEVTFTIDDTYTKTFNVEDASKETFARTMTLWSAATEYSSNVNTLEGCGLDYVLDFNFATDRDIRVLQITDTQIIDSTQVRENSTSTIPADLVELYDPANRDVALYNELTQLINENKPDLILLTGDITYGMFDDSGAAFQDLANQLDSYKVPWAPIFGNHEQETAIKTQGLCDILYASEYCLFTRRHEIGGNGNYAIGIAKNGHIQRTIYMMDSNGCWSADADDLATNLDGYTVANKRAMFQDEQIAWYRTVAARVNAHEGENASIPSFMCYHYPSAEILTAAVENGHQPVADTSTVSYKYDLGAGTGDFGFKQSSMASSGSNMKEYIYPYLQSAGTDGVFFGHQHTNSLSLTWKGIRWTYGLKTGQYESHPDATGGTLITISKDDGSFTVEHKPITSAQ